MKFTAIERFNGSAILLEIPEIFQLKNTPFIEFDSLNDLQKYVDQEKLKVNIRHLHGPGRNIRTNGR